MEFALPDLAGFAAAAVLIVLACALALLGALIANTFGRLPVVGSWVTSNIVASLTDASNAVLGASEATWHFAIGLLNWAGDALIQPFVYLVQYSVSVWTWINTLVSQTIPDAESRALTFASNLVTSLQADTRTLVSGAERYTDAAAAGVLAEARSLTAGAESYAAGLVRNTETALTADVTAAEHAAGNALAAAQSALQAGITDVARGADADLAALATGTNAIAARLASDITTEFRTAEAVANANLAAVQGGIYTDLETWGTKAVADAWPDADGDLAALQRTLGADFPWLKDLLPALAGAGAAGLLGALIRSMAAANVVTNLADDCIIPNCRNLSGLGNDLAGLASLFAEGAFWAWVAYAYADPAGWETDTGDVLIPVATDAVGLARTLFGVA